MPLVEHYGPGQFDLRDGGTGDVGDEGVEEEEKVAYATALAAR